MIKKEFVKALQALFQPADESLRLLHKIDKKLDLQAASRLRGHLRTLELAHESGECDRHIIEVCLDGFHESAEYYGSIAEESYNYYLKKFGADVNVGKVLLYFWIKGWFKFGYKMYQEAGVIVSETVNYSALCALSELGVLMCMKELAYPSHLINEAKERICNITLTGLMLMEKNEFGMAIRGQIPDPIPSVISDLIGQADSGTVSQRLSDAYYNYVFGRDTIRSIVTGSVNCGILWEAAYKSTDENSLIDELSRLMHDRLSQI